MYRCPDNGKGGVVAESKAVGKNQIAGMTLSEIQRFLVEEKAVLPYNYKLPYMMWYEDNFVGSSEVRNMHPTEEWMYRQLLAKAWVSKNAPYLPNNPETLKRLSGCKDQKLWDKHSPIVLEMFEKSANDAELFHSRQLIDYVIQIAKIAANISNGSKGGRPPKKRTETENNHMVPENNHPQRQLELEPELELKLDLEPDQDPVNGEDEDSDMKSETQIQMLSQRMLGKPAKFYGSTKEDLRRLEKTHKASAVIRAFEDWAGSLDEAPANPGIAFLNIADDLLSGNAPIQLAAKDPEVLDLTASLTYLSGRKVLFSDKERARLVLVLKTYTAEEITEAFKSFLGEQDLSVPKVQQWAAKNFSEAAGDLSYGVRRDRIEKAKESTARESAKLRLQEEAEAERAAAEVAKQAENQLFDPLA